MVLKGVRLHIKARALVLRVTLTAVSMLDDVYRDMRALARWTSYISGSVPFLHGNFCVTLMCPCVRRSIF